MLYDLSTATVLLIMGSMLLLLIASGMYISLVMGLVGIFMMVFMVGSGSNLGMLGILQYNVVADNFSLVALPLFIFMGYLVLHIGLAERIYDGSMRIVGFIPGGLLHANIFSSSVFAAMCGSSLATAASLGAIAIPLEIGQHKYPPRSVMGSLAAGGTLGILIPPSITFIAYGVFVGESVGQLFAAGFFPGVLLAAIFMTYIFLAAMISPATAGPRLKFSLMGMLVGIRRMWSAILLIGMILVTIYTGMATPTEAAGVGCIIAMAIGAGYRKINYRVLKEASIAALHTSCLLILLMVTAQIVSLALSMLEVPQRLTEAIVEANIGVGSLFAMIVLMYLFLGCFLEAGSMLFLTLPIVHPLMTSLGFSSVWLGVIMVILVELGAITPPVGFNLFVIHGVAEGQPMSEIIMGVIPYVFCMLAIIVILYFYPEIALWLPNYLFAPR